MRVKTNYLPAAPSSPVAKIAAIAVLLSGISFVFIYPALATRPAPNAVASTAGSTWSNITRREG